MSNIRFKAKSADLLPIISRDHRYHLIATRFRSNDGIIVDGAGQHKTIVVIRMLANQIDPPRRAKAVGWFTTELF